MKKLLTHQEMCNLIRQHKATFVCCNGQQAVYRVGTVHYEKTIENQYLQISCNRAAELLKEELFK